VGVSSGIKNNPSYEKPILGFYRLTASLCCFENKKNLCGIFYLQCGEVFFKSKASVFQASLPNKFKFGPLIMQFSYVFWKIKKPL
jgi:hypothetical protein